MHCALLDKREVKAFKFDHKRSKQLGEDSMHVSMNNPPNVLTPNKKHACTDGDGRRAGHIPFREHMQVRRGAHGEIDVCRPAGASSSMMRARIGGASNWKVINT